jgi:hypothetical protein
VNGENIIMSISENDALWNNISKEELAKKYKALISAAIIKYKVKPAWHISQRNRISVTCLDYYVCIISYLKSFLTGQHLKLNFRKTNESKE